MPGKGKYAAARALIGQSEDVVPLLLRIQVLIRDTQDAESVTNFILLQGSQNVCCVELLNAAVLPRCDLIGIDEVQRNFLFDNLALTIFISYNTASSDKFHLDTVEEGLAVELELLASLFINRTIDYEKVDNFLHPVKHPDQRPTLLKVLYRLPGLSLRDEPVTRAADSFGCEERLHVLKHVVEQWVLPLQVWRSLYSSCPLQAVSEKVWVCGHLRLRWNFGVRSFAFWLDSLDHILNYLFLIN